MSESQMQPGWYYAQGDAPGTQRYWDGAQWVGGPQAVGQQQDSAGGVAGGVPAEWVQRFIAFLVDFGIVFAIYVAVFIVGAIASAISDTLGSIVVLLGMLGVFAFVIWNHVVRQGQTGQTLGKSQQNLKLVSDATGQPVGIGTAILRWLVSSGISSVTCGIGGLVDVLWPLWDEDKKRLTDKILKFSVVNDA